MQTNNYVIVIGQIITFIGYLVTVYTVYKNFKNNIAVKKIELQLESSKDMILDILRLLDEFKKPKPDNVKTVKMVSDLSKKIISFGSKDAMRIFAALNYEANKKDGLEETKYKIAVLHPLLILQIKYDLMGAYISPDVFYQILISDFQGRYPEYVDANNALVKELRLNKKLLIDKKEI